MSPRQQIDERNDRMAAHLDPTILALRQHAWPWMVGRLALQPAGGSLSVPCSIQALMPDDANFTALGADFAC